MEHIRLAGNTFATNKDGSRPFRAKEIEDPCGRERRVVVNIYINTMLCEEDRPRRRIFRTEKPVPQRTRCRRAPRTTRQCNSSVARTKNIRHIVHAKKKKKIRDNNNVTLVIGFTREDTRLHVLHDLIFLYLFTVCSVSSVFLWSWFWIKEFTWNLNVYRFLYRSYWFSNL